MITAREIRINQVKKENLAQGFLYTCFENSEFTHITGIDRANQNLYLDVTPELRFKGSQSMFWYRDLSELMNDYNELKRTALC